MNCSSGGEEGNGTRGRRQSYTDITLQVHSGRLEGNGGGGREIPVAPCRLTCPCVLLIRTAPLLAVSVAVLPVSSTALLLAVMLIPLLLATATPVLVSTCTALFPRCDCNLPLRRQLHGRRRIKCHATVARQRYTVSAPNGNGAL